MAPGKPPRTPTGKQPVQRTTIKEWASVLLRMTRFLTHKPAHRRTPDVVVRRDTMARRQRPSDSTQVMPAVTDATDILPVVRSSDPHRTVDRQNASAPLPPSQQPHAVPVDLWRPQVGGDGPWAGIPVSEVRHNRQERLILTGLPADAPVQAEDPCPAADEDDEQWLVPAHHRALKVLRSEDPATRPYYNAEGSGEFATAPRQTVLPRMDVKGVWFRADDNRDRSLAGLHERWPRLGPPVMRYSVGTASPATVQFTAESYAQFDDARTNRKAS